MKYSFTNWNFTNWNQFATWQLLNLALPIALIIVSYILLKMKSRKVGNYGIIPVNVITMVCYAGVFLLTMTITRYFLYLPSIPAVLISVVVLFLTVLSYGRYVVRKFAA